jgi:hypothetical protein
MIQLKRYEGNDSERYSQLIVRNGLVGKAVQTGNLVLRIPSSRSLAVAFRFTPNVV